MSDSSESMPYRFTLIFQLDRLASSGGDMHPESIRDKAQKQDIFMRRLVLSKFCSRVKTGGGKTNAAGVLVGATGCGSVLF